MTSERGSEQGRGLDPVPIKGETFGEWRARKGESGTDTHAARSLAWDGDGWAKISEVDAVRAPVEPEHADGCAYYFADAADAESLCNCRGTSPRIIVEAGKPLPVSFSGLRAAGYEVAEPATREPPAPTDDPGAELARLLPGLPADVVTLRGIASLQLGEPHRETAQRVALSAELLLGERERLTREAPRPSPDRAAWLLHPVSSTGRETIAASQYEELRIEAVALRARAEEAERKLAAVATLQRSTAADLVAARAQLRLVSAGPADVWRWQGDGHDDPASLACPVVMSPATLREFAAARERVTELEATNERLRKRASDNLDASGLRALYAALEDGNMHSEAAMVQRLANGVATPPPGTVAALLARVRRLLTTDARDWSLVRTDAAIYGLIVGWGESIADVAALHGWSDEVASKMVDGATLGAPTPLDRAVAEVVALGQRPHPDSETNAADYLDHIETLATEMAPLDEPWEDIESERDRCKWIAALGLAGMLACDAADGGGKEQSK